MMYTNHATTPHVGQNISKTLSNLIPRDDIRKHLNHASQPIWNIFNTGSTINYAKPLQKHIFLVTITTSGFNTVKPWLFERTRQVTSALNCVNDVLAIYSFHILVSNFSAKEMHLTKIMMVAFATGPPAAVITVSFTLSYRSTMRTLDSVDQAAFSCVHPAYCCISDLMLAFVRYATRYIFTRKSCNNIMSTIIIGAFPK